ncbi:MAG: HDOD domain-containing protein [Paenisporosarcina sp.]
MEIFIGRQPIFDQNEKVYAFELLYRNSDLNTFPQIDGDRATMEVLVNSFLTIGLEDLTNGRPCFINFTENLLHEPIFDTLDSKYIIIEILENVQITPLVINNIRQLKQKGFKIALDDFTLTEQILLSKEIFSLVDFIKVDFMASTSDDRKRIETFFKSNYSHIHLLAEKVETRDEFEEAKKVGYHLFQGYFFSKPHIIQGKDIPANIANYFRIIRLISEEQANVTHIADLIERDVSLSFKLLKLINASPSRSKVRSIKQAVVVLGLTELHKWIYILAMRETMREEVDLSRNALIGSSLFRAKFCELLAKHNRKDNAAEYFLTGMFSLMDALLHKPFHQIMQQLPLSDQIVETLMGNHTDMSDYIELAIAFDQLDWARIQVFSEKLNLAEEQLRQSYNQAMRWSSQLA